MVSRFGTVLQGHSLYTAVIGTLVPSMLYVIDPGGRAGVFTVTQYKSSQIDDTARRLTFNMEGTIVDCSGLKSHHLGSGASRHLTHAEVVEAVRCTIDDGHSGPWNLLNQC